MPRAIVANLGSGGKGGRGSVNVAGEKLGQRALEGAGEMMGAIARSWLYSTGFRTFLHKKVSSF